MKIKECILTTLLLAGLPSCQSDDSSDSPSSLKERQDIPLTRSEIELADKTTDFSLTLFRQICRKDEGKNFLVSPLGAGALLNLMANGANGNTADEIYAALSPGGCDAQELNGFYSKLITWLPELDNTATIAQAYSLWMDNRFNMKNDYANFAKSVLGADVKQMNFQDPQSQQKLFQWCSDNTKGCIKQIDCDLTNAALVLVNALYFKGTWTDKFEASQTKKEKFYGMKQTSTVSIMHNEEASVGYAANEDFTAVTLPYGNKAYSMMLVLPSKDADMRQAGQALGNGAWKELSTQLRNIEIDLKIPKFELAYEISLLEIVESMNIKDAFSEKADFGKITESKSAYFNQFKQKSFISVNEKGTEAAAITWAGMDGVALGNGQTKLAVTFDRPFFFFIQEKSTGMILFMGKIENL